MKPKGNKTLDTSLLNILPLAQRNHDLDLSCLLELKQVTRSPMPLVETAKAIAEAKRRSADVVLMMGAHVIRSGVQRYLIDMMEKGWVTCLSMNGAGIIHDFEFALIGATTESVALYIKDGRFGLWQETGKINDIVSQAAKKGLGLGEAMGHAIAKGDFPYKKYSILAAAYRLSIPATVHVGIGYDIIYEHPNCDGAAYGQTSYKDFLILAQVLCNLEGGVVMNFGSAIMAPEVYLKALSMARNIARQQGRNINNFTTLVCDLLELPSDFHKEAERGSAGYYFRPWKTMLIRTVADGGHSHYMRGPHAQTIPALWSALQNTITHD